MIRLLPFLLLLTACTGLGHEFSRADRLVVDEVAFTLHRHPDRVSLRRAAINNLVYAGPDLCGFVNRKRTEVHVLWPRGWTDQARFAILGHEVMHIPDGAWHGSESVGFLCD